MARDWPVVATGVLLLLVATALAGFGVVEVAGIEQCTPNATDGNGDIPCRDGLDPAAWTADAVAPFVIAVVVAIAGLATAALGLRSRSA